MTWQLSKKYKSSAETRDYYVENTVETPRITDEYTPTKMNMQKRIAILTVYDFYGNQQVRNADILGPKPSIFTGMLYIQLITHCICSCSE